MSMSKPKKLNYAQRRQQETINKKAIIWVAGIIAAIVILMAVLLIWNP